MKKLLSVKTYQIFPDENGFLYAEKEINGEPPIFKRYDLKYMKSSPIKRSVYLQKKFGRKSEAFANCFTDCLSCDSCSFSGGKTAVLFPDGDIGWFDGDGHLLKEGKLQYKGSPAQCIFPDGNDAFWSVIPQENTILKISTVTERMIIRVGGGENSPFNHPSHIYKYDANLFVCDKEGFVKRVSLSDFRVSNYYRFDEPVYQYLRIGNSEVVCLESGVYLL